MNIKSFYVASLQSALDLEIATPEDVLVHATPDVLSDHLPRPLWARLLTACVGAPRVDAQLVIETIGVPNVCEHVPPTIVWNCLASIANRSLGGTAIAPAEYTRSTDAPNATDAWTSASSTSSSSISSMSSAFPSMSTTAEPARTPLATPPPPEELAPTPVPERPTAVGPSIPAPEKSLADIVAELDADEKIPAAPSRSRQPTGSRFRQSGTGIGRLANARRPQASAVATEVNRTRRTTTDGEYEIETDVSTQQAREDWKSNLAVEDEQLVDWASSDETVTGGGDDFGGRKR